MLHLAVVGWRRADGSVHYWMLGEGVGQVESGLVLKTEKGYYQIVSQVAR